jgi:hypothetical protein
MIGGRSPAPARIEIHRAIAHGGKSPDEMFETRGTAREDGLALVKQVAVGSRRSAAQQSSPPPDGPVNEYRRNGQ